MRINCAKTLPPFVALLACMAATTLGCQWLAPEPPPVRYLPTLIYSPGSVLLVEANGMRLVDNPTGPVPWRQKICTSLQFQMLILEGIVDLDFPDDWQTKQVHINVITQAGANTVRLANILRREGFTDVTIRTEENYSVDQPPGSVSGFLPYERLLALDAVANRKGVSRIQEIHPLVQSSGHRGSPSAPQTETTQ